MSFNTNKGNGIAGLHNYVQAEWTQCLRPHDDNCSAQSYIGLMIKPNK